MEEDEDDHPNFRKMTVTQYLQLDGNDQKKERAESKCEKIQNLLKEFSVGQYNTKMFHEESDSQSSMIGGIITILCGVFLLVYSTIILSGIIRKEIYNLKLQTF